MKLKVKKLGWSAGFPIAMLHLKTAERLGIKIRNRVSLKKSRRSKKEFFSVVDFSERFVRENQVGLSSEIFDVLGVKAGDEIAVELMPVPKSMEYIKRKLRGHTLKEEEINQIMKDIVSNALSDMEIAVLTSAMYEHGLNFNELVFFIKAMLKTGNGLTLKQKLIVDKHSIGGVPGNRTTPIVVAICAAAGLTFPKNSSRAITSAAGTADVIESIARVDFTKEEIETIVRKTGACLVWGGSLGVVPADSRIINVEKMLHIDPRSQLLASIMSKKLAAKGKFILIDIPYGEEAKVSKKDAKSLKRRFLALAKEFKVHLEVVLTNGEEPIGNGIGPMLEMTDVISVLDPSQVGPRDLEEKSLLLAGQILEMTRKVKKDRGKEEAKKILLSGKAFEKFKQIIKAQNGSFNRLRVGKYKKHIIAKKKGKVKNLKNKEMNTLARVLGSPVDKAAGIYLHCHKGDILKKGDKILTLYAESKARLKDGEEYYVQENPVEIQY